MALDPLPGERELLLMHLRTLFRFDALGRIVATNEPRGREGPRIYLGSASAERVVRWRADVGESAARAWLRCTDDAQVRERVAAHAAITEEYRGPAFVLLRVEPGEQAVRVDSSTPLHPELLARGWMADETPPYFGIVRDGLVVAVCYSSRATAEAAAAGVETATSYRGRALAVEAVRAWAAAVQASGKLAFYSTEWTNEASRRVAAKLGAIAFGEDWHLS